EIAGDRPAVVVDNRREPGACRLAALVEDANVERRVVRLPELVGSVGFPAVEQIERLSIRLGALVGQGQQPRVELADDGIDGTVARYPPALLLRDSRHLTMHEGGARRRRAQG